MGIRKILARDIRMKKNPQIKEDTFWIFTDFHVVMWGPKSNFHPRTEISSVASLTPKSSICCYVFKYFVLTVFFKKKRLLWQKIY